MDKNNIYSITQDCLTLYNRLIETADEETGEVDEVITKALAVKREEFEEKAVNTAVVVRMLKAKSAEAAAEIERITAIKKQIDNATERLTNGLSNACLQLGFEKIESVKGKISFKNSDKTIIDSAEDIPKEYLTEKTTYTPDKTKIKAAILAGVDVKGAHVEHCRNIQLK